MDTIAEGIIAPNFTGVNQNNKNISLEQFKGKKIILYFYPKDNTPGCTAEACNLRDNYDVLLSKGYEIIGISPDNDTSHLKFANKHKLPFNLIADTDKNIMKKYGVWGLKKLYGREYEGVLRTTFIIDEDGKIKKVFKKVKTKDHTNQILQEIE